MEVNLPTTNPTAFFRVKNPGTWLYRFVQLNLDCSLPPQQYA